MPTLRAALSRLVRHWHASLLQIAGLPLIAIGFAVWLWIPDAHVWQLMFTAVAAITLFIAFGAIQARTFGSYMERGGSGIILRAIAVLIWAALFFALMSLSDFGDISRYKLAAYWTSKLSAGARQTFTDTRIFHTLTFFNLALARYIVPSLLFPLGVLWGSSGLRAPYRLWLRALASHRYWVLMVPPALIATILPSLIVDWRPGQSVSAQVVSLIVRISLTYLIVLACWLFAAAVTAQVLLERSGSVPLVEANVPRDPVPQPA